MADFFALEVFSLGAAYLVTDGRTAAPMDKTYQILGGGIDGSIGPTWSWILAREAIAWMLINSVMVRRSYRKYGFKIKPLWSQILFLFIGIGPVYSFMRSSENKRVNTAEIV